MACGDKYWNLAELVIFGIGGKGEGFAQSEWWNVDRDR
jgi:hypothetical protein